jgi:hypothetical protein
VSCVVAVCVHTVLHTAFTALTALVCCVLYRFVFTQCFIQQLLHIQRLCVVPVCVHTVLHTAFSALTALACCLLQRFVFTHCFIQNLLHLRSLWVVCCTVLCSHSASYWIYSACVLYVVAACVHKLLHRAFTAITGLVCCVMYLFVFHSASCSPYYTYSACV